MPPQDRDQRPKTATPTGGDLVGDSGNVASPTSLSQAWRSQIPHYAQDEMDLFQDTIDAVMPGAKIQVDRSAFAISKPGEASTYAYSGDNLGYEAAGQRYQVTAYRDTPEGRRQIFTVDWADVGGRDMDWRALYSDATWNPADLEKRFTPHDPYQGGPAAKPISSTGTHIVGWNSIIEPENDTIGINENTVAGGYAGTILRRQAEASQYTMIPGF